MPAGTPQSVIDRLRAATNEVIAETGVRCQTSRDAVGQVLSVNARGIRTRLNFGNGAKVLGLTQHELAKRTGVSRSTIQNWESDTTALPKMIDDLCVLWSDRLKKEQADFGPVTLCYADGPMWVSAYGSNRRLASIQRNPIRRMPQRSHACGCCRGTG